MMQEAKKLTAAQVEELYAFTRRHYVEYYDLQTELADHLANGIEKQWEQGKNPDFEDALAAEFKKFGIYGFSDVVAARRKAMDWRYLKLAGAFFINFFTPPKLLLTLALVYGARLLFVHQYYIFMGLMFAVQMATIIKFTRQGNLLEAKVKQTGKRWLLEEMIFKGASVSSVMIFSIQLMQFMGPGPSPAYVSWVAGGLAALIMLHNYIVLYSIPAKAEKYLTETYPEYRFEN